MCCVTHEQLRATSWAGPSHRAVRLIHPVHRHAKQDIPEHSLCLKCVFAAVSKGSAGFECAKAPLQAKPPKHTETEDAMIACRRSGRGGEVGGNGAAGGGRKSSSSLRMRARPLPPCTPQMHHAEVWPQAMLATAPYVERRTP